MKRKLKMPKEFYTLSERSDENMIVLASFDDRDKLRAFIKEWLSFNETDIDSCVDEFEVLCFTPCESFSEYFGKDQCNFKHEVDIKKLLEETPKLERYCKRCKALIHSVYVETESGCSFCDWFHENYEYDHNGRLYGIDRTELELKAIQWFKDVLHEPLDKDQLKIMEHVLQPFYDGYASGQYNLDNDPDLQDRIQVFLRIVGDDMAGNLEYSDGAYEKVFGLIKELGL